MLTFKVIESMKIVIVILLVIVAWGACDKATLPSNLPHCVKLKIDELQNNQVTNPPSKVFEYTYHNEKVYYIPPICCDFYGTVYNENCEIICHPDGGITGHGDGKCANFFKEATNGKLVWEDNRK